jgi:type IV pilus assembly protein PilM
MSALAKAVGLFRPGTGDRQIGPIGVDFALESLQLVQLESVGGQSPVVYARATVPYEASRHDILADPLLFTSVVKNGLAADSFHGRKAVMAVPTGLFRTLSINYQTGPELDDAAAILRIMQHRLDGDLSDFVLDYLPVRNRSKNDEKLALVAVSEREPIVALLEAARKAKLDVDALEIGPVAISRLVGAMSMATSTAASNVLVINSGRQASYLTLISGEDLLFDQQVSFGENELVHQLADTLDMSDDMARDLVLRTGIAPNDDPTATAIDDAGLLRTMAQIVKPQFMRLVDEIKRVCLYAAAETRGGAVTQVYLLGSIARWPGSDGLLSSMIDLKIAKIPDPLAPFAEVSDSTIVNAPVSAPEIAVATGLALRGLHGDG